MAIRSYAAHSAATLCAATWLFAAFWKLIEPADLRAALARVVRTDRHGSGNPPADGEHDPERHQRQPAREQEARAGVAGAREPGGSVLVDAQPGG